MGIGDWGLGPIPNPQSPIYKLILININYNEFILTLLNINNKINIIMINS